MAEETGWVLSFFEWCEATTLGRMVRESLYAFPILEAIHLVALAMLGGALLIVNLRLLGVGMKDSTIARIDKQARPWLLVSIGVLLLTGVPLFLSEAIKCYYNTAFWVKITTLPFAIAFTLGVKERFARTALYTTAYSQWIAGVDVLLWFIVAAGGRWIGFS